MVRLMIRTAGAVLVVAGAAGLGTFFSSRFLLRLRLLEDLRKLVFLLKGEILYGNSSLEEAFARAGGRLDGRLGRLAERTGRCRRGPCSSIWNSWSWP